MKYVVAEAEMGSFKQRTVIDADRWKILNRLGAGWVKLFETETVAEAEALEALLPPAERIDKHINRS